MDNLLKSGLGRASAPLGWPEAEMGLDGPLCFRDHVRERGGLDGAHDDAGVVVDDGAPGQAELDDVNAVAPIEARLSMTRLHVDRISR